MNATIALFAEDQPQAQELSRCLERQGFDVVEMHFDLQNSSPQRKDIDLVIMDIPMLLREADVDKVVRETKFWRHVPIVNLLHLRDRDVGVHLLDLGADNYIFKPINYDELFAKIRAPLRRLTMSTRVKRENVIQIDQLKINLTAKRAFVNTRDIRLTQKEFLLLAELATRKGQICSHEELLRRAWGDEYWDAHHYLHVYFGRIRRKIGQPYGELIETVPGMGYLFQNEPVKIEMRR
jgi:DNA-binding response OmpR family regulator